MVLCAYEPRVIDTKALAAETGKNMGEQQHPSVLP